MAQNSMSSGPPVFPCREGKGSHAGQDHNKGVWAELILESDVWGPEEGPFG